MADPAELGYKHPVSDVVRPNFKIKSREIKSHIRAVVFQTNQKTFDAIRSAIEGAPKSQQELMERALERYLNLPEGTATPFKR